MKRSDSFQPRQSCCPSAHLEKSTRSRPVNEGNINRHSLLARIEMSFELRISILLGSFALLSLFDVDPNPVQEI
jgi:hypothetical protein